VDEHNIFWSALRWVGFEHLRVRVDGRGVVLDGMAIAMREGPQRVGYQIRCDAAWNARAIEVRRLDGGSGLTLESDGTGRWRLGGGAVLSALDGCTDVDFALTPATNTLPIRRLALAPYQAANITVAYVEFPSLRLRAATQRYTRLGDRVYRYESASFRADLPVDDFGLVLDYPGVWKRVETA
jgi:hypothetical protein